MTKLSSHAQPNAAQYSHFDIIPETELHAEAIEALHVSAFGPGRFARAAFRIREQGGHDKQLAFVAMDGSTLLGSVRLTWVETTNSKSRGLLLGPLAVQSGAQNKGIGRALVAQCIEAAANTNAAYVMLVGDQPYYGPLGFEIAPIGQVNMPGPVDGARLLVHALAGFDAGQMSGLVRHIDLAG